MSDVSYHQIGHQPDVAEGRHEVYVTLLGSWEPLFSLTPAEAELFARRVLRAAARIREAEARGEQRPVAEPRTIRKVVGINEYVGRLIGEESPPRIDPFTYARQPLRRPGVWRQRVAFCVFAGGLLALGLWAISALGGAG